MEGFTVTAGHGINYEFATTLNPTLVDIAARGNTDYIGKTVELGMPASATVYQNFILVWQANWPIFQWGVERAISMAGTTCTPKDEFSTYH